MMVQHTFVDCSPKPLHKKWKSTKPEYTWSLGNTLISMHVLEDMKEMGKRCEIVFRRPVGITVFQTIIQNELGLMKFGQDGLDQKINSSADMDWNSRQHLRSNSAESYQDISDQKFIRSRSLSIESHQSQSLKMIENENQTPCLDPTFLILQFQPYPIVNRIQEVPRLLPDDESSTRALSVLDRTPSIDLHKIGVVFVAFGQTKESEILSNVNGSEFYAAFLKLLGNLVVLADNRDIYTGGLDTSSDALDGKFGLIFIPDQRLTQMIFHVTTMMPTNEVGDPNGTAKKRHIGNDFVMIIWNEAGPYNRETIPGQFNLIHIIIEPVSGLPENGYNLFSFRVTISFREDIPVATPLSILISGKSLGSFVRQTAIYCNMIAQVFISGEATSNAKERLRQIKRLRSRLDSAPVQTLDFSFLRSSQSL